MAFNAKKYLEENPDVAAAVARGETTAEDHWAQFGRKERRRGGFDVPGHFDPVLYLSQNPDVRAAVESGALSPEEHYALYGQGEGRFAGAQVVDQRPGTTGTPGPIEPKNWDPANPPRPKLSADVQDLVSRYADLPDASGLRAGGLADRLAQDIITPWRELLRQVKGGSLGEADYRTKADELVAKRDQILGGADPADFSEAIRYAGGVTPGFLEAVAKAGASAIDRSRQAGTKAASLLSAPSQPANDMQAAADAAAERARVRQRRGRGAMMLTGATGLDPSGASVARRLLMGAAA